MSKRIEQPRPDGHLNSRCTSPSGGAMSSDGRVSVVTPRNPPPPARLDGGSGGRGKSFRYELSDRDGNYRGTFVTDVEHWQMGDVFTSGDGRPLRIVAIAAPGKSRDRPTYTGGWEVEPIPTPS